MGKILIVDDTAFMRLNIKNILGPLNYEFKEASNGIEAIDMYKSQHPDLVIMDITMPDMDGLEALRQIKALDKDAKILMCSAVGQQGRIVEAIECGASNYIIKPFQNDKFFETVKKILGIN